MVSGDHVFVELESSPQHDQDTCHLNHKTETSENKSTSRDRHEVNVINYTCYEAGCIAFKAHIVALFFIATIVACFVVRSVFVKSDFPRLMILICGLMIAALSIGFALGSCVDDICCGKRVKIRRKTGKDIIFAALDPAMIWSAEQSVLSTSDLMQKLDEWHEEDGYIQPFSLRTYKSEVLMADGSTSVETTTMEDFGPRIDLTTVRDLSPSAEDLHKALIKVDHKVAVVCTEIKHVFDDDATTRYVRRKSSGYDTFLHGLYGDITPHYIKVNTTSDPIRCHSFWRIIGYFCGLNCCLECVWLMMYPQIRITLGKSLKMKSKKSKKNATVNQKNNQLTEPPQPPESPESSESSDIRMSNEGHSSDSE